MSNLMYSSQNDQLVTRQELAALPVPEPKGSRHVIYPYSDYVQTVADQLNLYGFNIAEEEFAIQKDGQRFFGLMQLNPILEGEYIPHCKDQYTYQVGLRGAYDQSLDRGLLLGTRAIVCSNLCFHGNLITLKTRQTTNVVDRIVSMIEEAVRTLPEKIKHQGLIFDKLLDYTISPNAGENYLASMYRQEILTAMQLPRAIIQWHEPTYAEHAEEGYTAWRLLQAVTEVQKPQNNRVNHFDVINRTGAASQYIEGIVLH